jgi:predicted NBD/HSP70 family sugar kinase/DNA-binding XRE family transcriptional regulator
MKTTGDHHLVKRINRSILLRLVRAQPGLSRAQLAQESGLTKSTVGLLIKELMDEGWLCEAASLTSSALGRPHTPLQIDTSQRALIGAELAVDQLRVVGVSLLGDVLCTVQAPLTQHEPAAVCKQLAALIAHIHGELNKQGIAACGVGVGLPGALDQATGRVWFAPNLQWQQVDITAQLTDALLAANVPAMPVYVDNDADTGALSEYEFGVQRQQSALIFITCGVGIGAGIVLNDRLFTGAQGMAGEVGHSVLQINGPLCRCGRRGCAEAFIGAQAIADSLQRTGHTDSAGEHLGVLLHNLWTTLSPHTLVLGGPSCIEHPALVSKAHEVLQRYTQHTGMSPPELRVARYGLLASAVGAAALVLYHYLRPIGTA